ncbi:unnamed protein product [Victoria cruziana]
MKELLRRCPHHQVPKWQILHGFYDGLSDVLKQTIDSSCGGSLMMKNENDVWHLFDTLSENSIHNTGPSSFRQSGRKEILEVGPTAHIQGQLDALSRKMDSLLSSGYYGTRNVCQVCHMAGHSSDECPNQSIDSSGQTNVAQGFSHPSYDPYSSTYNTGWRNHPNFGWRSGSSQSHTPSPGGAPYQSSQGKQYSFNQPSLTQGPASSSTGLSWPERILRTCEDIKSSQQKSEAKYDQVLRSHTQTLQQLENQIRHLASTINHRQDGSLPSQPVNNPKGKWILNISDDPGPHGANAILTLKSGRDYHPKSQDHPVRSSRKEKMLAAGFPAKNIRRRRGERK